MSVLTLPAPVRSWETPEQDFADTPVWTPVADGFWAGFGRRGFTGTVELLRGRFTAFDAEGVEIGRYELLADAQSAVATPATRGYSRRLARAEAERRLAVAAAVVGGLSCLGSGLLIALGLFV